LALLIVRWFCTNITWEGQTEPLRFTGGYWPMLGWSVLLPLSVITIIGWAWVATAWTLDVQKRAGLFGRACFHRQRLGLSVARAGGGRHRHLSHSDSMDRALVHALARFANCAC
jgi:hypothetical protein